MKVIHEELDILRGFALLGLILRNITYTFNTIKFNEKPIFSFGINFVTDVTFFFMFLIGITMFLSKENNIAEIILKKGLKFLIAGFTLNSFRALIFYLIAKKTYGVANLIPVGGISCFSPIFNGDFYHFLGLFFLLFGLILFLKIPINTAFITILVSIFLIKPIFLKENEIIYWIYFLGYFYPLKSYTGHMLIPIFFPLLSWIFYPLTGYFFGYLIQKYENDKEKMYRILLKISFFVCIILTYVLIIKHPLYNPFGLGKNNTQYYLQDSIAYISISPYIIFVLSLIFSIKDIIIPQKVKTFLIHLSKNIITYYVLQWIIVDSLRLLIGQYFNSSYILWIIYYFLTLSLIVIFANICLKIKKIIII